MIEISVTNYPQKELVAICGECKKEVWRKEWHTYGNCARVKAQMKRNLKTCPHCGKKAMDRTLTGPSENEIATSPTASRNDKHGKSQTERNDTPKWEKHIDIYGRTTADWEVKLKYGDFLVWKEGKIWRGRYREYDSYSPIMLGFSSTLEGMKRRCENSVYWRKEEE